MFLLVFISGCGHSAQYSLPPFEWRAGSPLALDVDTVICRIEASDVYLDIIGIMPPHKTSMGLGIEERGLHYDWTEAGIEAPYEAARLRSIDQMKLCMLTRGYVRTDNEGE